MSVADAAMLRLVEEAGEGVLHLVDGVERDEFGRSRLTRTEARRQLRIVARTLAALRPATRDAMPEIDWAGWKAAGIAMDAASRLQGDDAAWFAARSLVPATLSWLRVYRREQPALFAFG